MNSDYCVAFIMQNFTKGVEFKVALEKSNSQTALSACVADIPYLLCMCRLYIPVYQNDLLIFWPLLTCFPSFLI